MIAYSEVPADDESTGVLDRVLVAIEEGSRPEYTGENRCWPCTLLNVALLALVTAIVWSRSPRSRTRAFALALGAGGIVAVWKRGYFVPYTPQFAPRVVSILPGDPFDERVPVDAANGLNELNESDAVDPETLVRDLERAGVLVVEGENLRPSSAFRSAWNEEMARRRDNSTDALAAEVERYASDGVDVRRVSPFDREWIVLSSGSATSESWVSRPIAIADLAAADALRSVAPELDELKRRSGARHFRLFLETCPDCEGKLVETTADNCCGGTRDSGSREPLLACEDCDRRVVTLPNDS